MENTSYALHIAVGVLIGIAILSLVVFNWRKIGGYENSKEEITAVKNKAEFNAQFEAFNKSLMYGTDVLSCLNKAQNNNQKYVYNNYYGTDMATIGKDDRAEFFMDVEVTLKSDLCDTIKAYYKNSKGKYERVMGLNPSQINSVPYKKTVFKDDGTKKTFNDIPIYYYYFKKGLVYQDTSKYTDIMWEIKADTLTLGKVLSDGGQIKTLIKGGTTYGLLEAEEGGRTSSLDEIIQAARLSALITTVSLSEQKLENSLNPTANDGSDWNYCTWTTAASDFKTRKFKCTGVEYNEDNGYIKKISFVEYTGKE